MTRIYNEMEIETGTFPEQPENVITASVSGRSDLFVEGTVPARLDYGGRMFEICADSGMLATPWCWNTFRQYYSLNGDASLPSIDIAPRWYCPLHSQDHGHYPTKEGEAAGDYVAPNFSHNPG